MSETNEANEVPKLYMKCISYSIPCDWWEVGKLYLVVNDAITADVSLSGKSVNRGPHPVDRALTGKLSGDFIPVWLLPDGTELEALE